MSSPLPVRPPWLGRVLSRLIAGPDAESLRGDLEESFHRRVADHGDSLGVRVEYVLDATSSLVQWWWAALTGDALRGVPSEIRHVVRGLVRRPGYAAIVMITLGLGIGATTTIYTVVDALLIRPLPYRGAERLVVVGNTLPGHEWVAAREGLQQLQPMSYPNVAGLATRVRSIDRIEAIERNGWISTDRETGLSEVVRNGRSRGRARRNCGHAAPAGPAVPAHAT